MAFCILVKYDTGDESDMEGKKNTKFTKKIWSIIICTSMVLSCIPSSAFTVTAAESCKHHKTHDAECGYVEAAEGTPCTHKHTESCYSIIQCIHKHDKKECGEEGEKCTHVCSVENGCITMKLNCHHTHNAECGYSEGSSAQPCGHIHDTTCGYTAEEGEASCTHIHDDNCGYAEAVEGTPCRHIHSIKVDDEESCYELLCSHAEEGMHDAACGYTETTAGSPCQYECTICSEEEEGTLPKEESDARISEETGTDDESLDESKDAASVREMIKALPDVSTLKTMSSEEQQEELQEYILGSARTKAAPKYDSANHSYYGDGYDLYIDKGTDSSKTVVYYYVNGEKQYLNASKEKGDDLSNETVVGAYGSDGDNDSYVYTVRMYGGNVKRVYAVGYGNTQLKINIVITGGTVSTVGSKVNQFAHFKESSLYSSVSTNKGYYFFNTYLMKNGEHNWDVYGNPTVPSDVTMTLDEADTMNIPDTTTITNAGKIINYGAAITGKGTVVNSGNGSVTCHKHSYRSDYTPSDKGDGTHVSACYFHSDVFSEGVACTFDSNGICTECGGYQPAVWNSSKSAYEISNYGQLLWYGKYGSEKNGCLVSDIKIGSSSSPYTDWTSVAVSGGNWFDGQGHTIEMYLTYSNVDGTAGTGYVGLFAAVDGATLKNMIIKGDLKCNIKDNGAAGRVGAVNGSSFGVTFENIISYADVTNQSDAPTGGITGYFGRNNGNAIMRNCAVYANVTGTGDTGGLVGRGWNETQYWKFYNCAYNNGTISGKDGRVGALMGYSDTKASSVKKSVIDRFYYPEGLSVFGSVEAEGYTMTNCESKTAAQFASGEVTWLLNSKNNSGTGVWKQTINTDALPTFSGDSVYGIEETVANLYTNDSDIIKKNSNGYYEIYRPNQLDMFADLANLGNQSINAILMADIDMSGYDWPTICSTGLYYSNSYSSGSYPDAGFAGTFDGNYHVIKNLSVTSESGKEATYGLFGSLSGTVKNLGIDGFTYTHKASDIRAGSIAGQILAGKIINCYVVNATITPGVNVAGGIAGCNYAGTIENCHIYNSQVKASSTRYGWIVGDNRADSANDRKGTIKNCYTNGSNLVGSYTGTETDSAIKDAASFKSGEVTYLLNGQKAAGVWKQTVGKAEYPCFTGLPVYKNGTQYDNTSMDTDSNNFYLISNYDELLQFADIVNEKDASVNGKMVNDIDGTPSTSWRIGTSANPYTGQFDGSGYTLKVKLAGTDRVAAFSRVKGAQIRNLVVEGTITASDKFAGGIIGSVEASSSTTTILENCLSKVTITSSVNGDGTHGGLLGVADSAVTINNCGFSGSITGASTHACGGLVGWAGAAVKINHSYVAGSFDSLNAESGNTFSRNPGKVTLTNCYYLNALNSTPSGATKKTLEQFKSGEVAWLLNNRSQGVWKQKIGKDDYPVFKGEPVYPMSDIYVNYDPPETDSDGIYEIYTPTHLMAFAQYVNQKKYDANAKVMSDLDMSSYSGKWIAIGQTEMSNTVAYGYQGTFDGQGHTIRNITFETPASATSNGLFGTVYTGGVVKKVGIENMNFDNDAYDHRAGGIAGQLMQGAAIENCFVVNSTLKAASRVVGGVAGMNLGTIRNCYTKDLTLAAHKDRFGGICGDFTEGTVENCYTDYSVIGSSESGTVNSSEAAVSAARFQSGEITYLLNGDQNTITWYQTCGEGLPAFTGKQVYMHYVTCDHKEKMYSNEVEGEKESHQYTSEPVFEWASDYSSCTATFTCAVNSEHEKLISECDISSETSEDGTITTLTATVIQDGNTYTDVQKIKNRVIKVEVAWTTMDFTYSVNKKWNPSAHAYDKTASWKNEENGGKVTVKNTGNQKVSVTLKFEGIEGITGSYDKEKMDLEVEGSDTSTLTISGEGAESLNKTEIGSTTVSVAEFSDATENDETEGITVKNSIVKNDTTVQGD